VRGRRRVWADANEIAHKASAKTRSDRNVEFSLTAANAEGAAGNTEENSVFLSEILSVLGGLIVFKII
jgi:hypothetical protein